MKYKIILGYIFEILIILSAVFTRDLYRQQRRTNTSRNIITLISTTVAPMIKRPKMWRKKEDFLAEKCTGVGMKGSKRKHGLIKDNISGYVDPTSRNIKAFNPFMHGTIA